ncbi:MAG: hypothetical protein ABIK09_07450 [Pseudomonadota bacterium]
MSIRSIILLSVFVVACSQPGESVSSGPDIDADGAADLGAGGDVTFEDLAGSDLPPVDDHAAPPADLSPDGLEPACAPGEGCFLDPCDDNAQCLSGWCVEHMGEDVCTRDCSEDCPPGWSCRPVGTGGPDVASVCISDVSNLCKPCAMSGDCKALGGADDVCVAYGAEGSFCGASCDAVGADGCPWGFSCQDAGTVDGIAVTQCVADAGVCPCTAKSTALALWTPCVVENGDGACAGKRVCTGEGLAACDALTPAEELCNGADDDCDGDVDEPLEVEGDYVPLCDDGNLCTADACGGSDGCSHMALDGGECLDGDPCTVGDHCEAGVCLGSPVTCDDGNPCTDDLCQATGGCIFPANTAACDDGDPCTLGDHCAEGACVSVPVDCQCQVDGDCAALEDGDLCNGTLVCDAAALPHLCVVDPGTVIACPGPPDGLGAICLKASCDPDTGACALAPDHPGAACDDGDLCTLGDTCSEGACVGGPPPLCMDGNPCTDDSCASQSGCAFTPNTALCDDGNACTTGDICAGGACGYGGAVACDDGDPCTDDTCAPGSGCVHTLNEAPCSDGDLCTTGDHCHLGSCIAGGGLACVDGNPCTDDACAPLSGCTFTVNDDPCDDGSTCTVGDHCAGGACVITGVLACDDGNPCTDDACEAPGGCTHAPNSAPCSDGDPCTVGDHCAGGSCVTGGGAADCDDDNPCTDDWCQGDQGCHHAYNSLPCDDGDACTAGDICVVGICVAFGVVDCDDEDVCTDDGCVPAVGCLNVPNTAACDDGDACTPLSTCQAGACLGQGAIFCDPAAHCAENDCVPACFTAACAPASGCVFTPIAACCGNLLVETPETCDDGNLVDGDGCSALCESEGPPGIYFVLAGTPDPGHVFDTIERTFRYENNLTNGIWHGPSNTIVVGDYDYVGYWHHAADAGGYPHNPDHGTGYYVRMVQMPGRNLAAYTVTTSGSGSANATPSDLRLAALDPATGTLGAPFSVTLSDGYNGSVNVISSSVTELMIWDGVSTIRRYEVPVAGGALELVGTVTLASGLPASATCNSGCYGGTFAWDGKYFYFSMIQNSQGGLQYRVYTETGGVVGTYTAAGSGHLNSAYFDWSVGRYTSHDGYGDREGGSVYSSQGGTGDSQVYSPVSPVHTLHID